jgi:hypothetical protein
VYRSRVLCADAGLNNANEGARELMFRVIVRDENFPTLSLAKCRLELRSVIPLYYVIEDDR